jgi:hypothetical protein
MKLLFLLLIFLPFHFLSSQVLLSDIVDPSFNNSSLVFGYGDYDGTPYLNKNWNSVQINTSLNGILEAEEANFDIYSQKLIAMKDGKSIWVNDHQINFFLLKDDIGREKKYIKRQLGQEYEYYEVIHEGRLHIFKGFRKKFVRPNENSNHNYGSEVSEKPYFSRESLTYYISFDEGKEKKSPLSKKAIENILPEKYKRKYKQLLKKEKVSFKKEEELKSFLQRFETELKE